MYTTIVVNAKSSKNIIEHLSEDKSEVVAIFDYDPDCLESIGDIIMDLDDSNLSDRCKIVIGDSKAQIMFYPTDAIVYCGYSIKIEIEGNYDEINTC